MKAFLEIAKGFISSDTNAAGTDAPETDPETAPASQHVFGGALRMSAPMGVRIFEASNRKRLLFIGDDREHEKNGSTHWRHDLCAFIDLFEDSVHDLTVEVLRETTWVNRKESYIGWQPYVNRGMEPLRREITSEQETPRE
nr:hypothetical protein TetV2_00004 [Oceanusvirus sp.]